MKIQIKSTEENINTITNEYTDTFILDNDQVSNGSIWHHQHHHQQQGHHNIIKFTLRYIDNDDAAGLSGFIQNVHVQVYFTFFLQAIVKMTGSLALGGRLLAQRHFHRNSKLSWIIQLGCVSWGMNWKRDRGQSKFSCKFQNFPKMQSCTNGQEYSISWLRIHPSRAPISISSLISAEGLWLLIMRAIGAMWIAHDNNNGIATVKKGDVEDENKTFGWKGGRCWNQWGSARDVGTLPPMIIVAGFVWDEFNRCGSWFQNRLISDSH